MKDRAILTVVITVLILIFVFIGVTVIVHNNSTDDNSVTSSDINSNFNNQSGSNSDDSNNSLSDNSEGDFESNLWDKINISHNDDAYECKISQDKSNDKGYIIYYPNIENTYVDEKISNIVSSFIDMYKDKYNDSALVTDYKTYISENNLLTVAFNSTVYNSEGEIKYNDISTYTYKLNDSKTMSQSDIFKDTFYSFANKKALTILEDNGIDINSEQVKNAVSANAENFSDFAFDDNFCYIFYSTYSFSLSTANLITVKIDKSEVKDYMKIKFDGSKYSSYEYQGNKEIDPNKPMVALTFDDGPSYAYTPILLDALEKYGVRVTFFVVGTGVASYPNIVKRAYDLGCQIGNHTQNHASLSSLSTSEMINEVESVNDKLENIIGQRATMVRPPYGAYNSTVRATLDYPLILWGVDTEDWKTRNADLVEQAILDNAYDGAIILLHDIHKTSVEGAVRAIPQLLEQGYQLVTVEELLYYRGDTVEAGGTYF